MSVALRVGSDGMGLPHGNTFPLAIPQYTVSSQHIRIFGECVEGFPSMDNWLSIDFCDACKDTVLQLLNGGNADVLKKSSGHLAKECFGDIEPRSVGGSEDVPEPVGVVPQITASLFGKVSGVVVQNDTDDAFGRIVGVQVLEQGDEFDAAMTRLNSGDDMSVEQVQGSQDGQCAKSLILMVP